MMAVTVQEFLDKAVGSPGWLTVILLPLLPLVTWFAKTYVDHFLKRKLADREAENRSHFEDRVPVLKELSTFVERLVEAAKSNVTFAQDIKSPDDRRPRKDKHDRAMKELWDYHRDNK